ncbi:helix-turn-helix domain-containing protein [Lysinibacillus sp. NPDC092081]|uniref:helix-turn-helix domain-containing protein n=1 Tax=Lysinibacillus sp. NPDC092081 TaxID=3364131 RepID=UPI00381CC376
MQQEQSFTIESEYKPYLEMLGFSVDHHFPTKPGALFSLDPSVGEGTVWVYAKTGHFFIQAMDFYFYEEVPFEYPQFDFISFGYYESSLYADKHAVFYSPYLLGYRSRTQVFKCLIPKREAVRNICIVLAPAYYEHYLSKTYPDEYNELLTALEQQHGLLHLPELVLLLKQIMNFTGNSAAAKIYYESKVAEMLALIVNHSHNQKTQKCLLSEQDRNGISAVLTCLDSHYGDFSISIEQLAKLACMSPTKLKYTFKNAYNCTISEYICRKRIQEAKHALEHSQINIGEIAKKLGYKKTRSFSDYFRTHTGLLPSEYRKLAQGKISTYSGR